MRSQRVDAVDAALSSGLLRWSEARHWIEVFQLARDGVEDLSLHLVVIGTVDGQWVPRQRPKPVELDSAAQEGVASVDDRAGRVIRLKDAVVRPWGEWEELDLTQT